MRNLGRARVWVRLVIAVAAASVLAGWVGGLSMYWFSRYTSNELSLFRVEDAARGDRGYIFERSISRLETQSRIAERSDYLDWPRITFQSLTEASIPEWAVKSALNNAISHDRYDIGWPMRFMRIEFSDYPDAGTTDSGIFQFGFIPFATRPLFPGFLLLVAMTYGIVFTVEWVVRLAWTRQTRRILRGCCGRCGYDLAGIAGSVCPECGVSQAERI